MCKFGLALAVILTLFASSAAAEQSDGPRLMLDPGGHMSLIRSLVFTADGKQLISTADDKVIRVWDVASGATVRTIRGQVGDGNAGKIYALALSPDGRLLAASGRMGDGTKETHSIRIHDFDTGNIVTVLPGHSDAVLSLAFSPDGKLLASGSADDTAAIWDVAGKTLLHSLQGHTADINRVAFTNDGLRLATGSDDKTVGLWHAADGALISRTAPQAGNVFGLAVSPTSGVIASASQGGQIALWDGNDLRQVRQFPRQKSDILSLSFSPDGKTLLTGVGTAPYAIVAFDAEGGRPLITYRGHDQIVVATAISPNGDLAATAGGKDNEIHLWDLRTGKFERALKGTGRSVWAVGFSEDNKRISWGYTSKTRSYNDRGQLEFALALPEGDRPTGEPQPLRQGEQKFRRAHTGVDNVRLNHRVGGNYGYFADLDIVRSGKVAATIRRDETSGFAHNAYTLTPDGGTVITGGGNGWLTAFDTKGNSLGDFLGHTSDIWTVAASPDGELLLSGGDDQTVRLWNVKTRENIASLFQGSDGEWVIWTPQGFYAASPGGDAHVGWHVNEGEGQAARFVTAAQLKQHFYRPDIIRRALILRSAERAVRESGVMQFSVNELIRRRPPEVAILSPPEGVELEAASSTVVIRAGEMLDPIQEFDVVVNGRRITSAKPKKDAAVAQEEEFLVPLLPGANDIEIVAKNAIGQTLLRRKINSTTSITEPRGTLFLVAIGVNDYPNIPGNNLEYAAIDANKFYDAVLAKVAPLYREVRGKLLSKDGDLSPTAENVTLALKTLEDARPEDTTILFLAGHGVNQGPDYLFLPTDAALTSGVFEPTSVVNWRLLQSTIETTKGRRIMLVDTCHSGNAFNARLIKDSADARIVVFAATDAETEAQEKPELGHGVFTYSVLRGMDGEADVVVDQRVDISELNSFASKLVRDLTENSQSPTFHLAGGRNFVFSQFKP